MNYLQEIEKNVDLLKKHGATLQRFSYEQGLQVQVLEQIQNDLKIAFSETFIGLFKSLNGLTLDWTYEQNGARYDGWIRWPSIHNAVGMKEANGKFRIDQLHFEELLWTDTYDEEEIAVRKRMILIESIPGSDLNVTIKRNRKIAKSELYAVDAMDVVNTGKSLEAYLTFVIRVMGMQQLRNCFLEKDTEQCLANHPEWEVVQKLLQP